MGKQMKEAEIMNREIKISYLFVHGIKEFKD